jgi:diaminopimelate epimerase
MTGTGNDFILIDNREGLLNADHCQNLVRQACRRKLSVGADGMILIERDPEVDFKWRFFNADASEAEMCGNGARCAARFACLTGIVAQPRMAFRTLAGIIKAEVSFGRVKGSNDPTPQPPDGYSSRVNRIPSIWILSTRVPHVVCFATNAQELESTMFRTGASSQFHPHFQPAGTMSISFACRMHIGAVRTYERGLKGDRLRNRRHSVLAHFRRKGSGCSLLKCIPGAVRL